MCVHARTVILVVILNGWPPIVDDAVRWGPNSAVGVGSILMQQSLTRCSNNSTARQSPAPKSLSQVRWFLRRFERYCLVGDDDLTIIEYLALMGVLTIPRQRLRGGVK